MYTDAQQRTSGPNRSDNPTVVNKNASVIFSLVLQHCQNIPVLIIG